MRRARIGVFVPVWLVVGLLAPSARPQSPVAQRATVFRYQDDDGPGRLIIEPVGAAEGGQSLVRVTLEQKGVRYTGSGSSDTLPSQRPPRTLYAFSITSPHGAYFFVGETTSGITVAGNGTYHRVGSPERCYPWNIVLGR